MPPRIARDVVKKYIAAKGMLIESSDQYIWHVVKPSGGVSQAIYDMLDESSKERLIDKRKIREMCHVQVFAIWTLRPW